MLKGHSRLPNDRDFGSIENAKKTSSAMVPEEYIKLIQNSQTGENKFVVKEMKQHDFFYYKSLSREMINLQTKTLENLLILEIYIGLAMVPDLC